MPPCQGGGLGSIPSRSTNAFQVLRQHVSLVLRQAGFDSLVRLHRSRYGPEITEGSYPSSWGSTPPAATIGPWWNGIHGSLRGCCPCGLRVRLPPDLPNALACGVAVARLAVNHPGLVRIQACQPSSCPMVGLLFRNQHLRVRLPAGAPYSCSFSG